MGDKVEPSSISKTFQPMPMAHLIANIKTMPAQVSPVNSNNFDDSGSGNLLPQKSVSVQSNRHTPVPKSASANKENRVFSSYDSVKAKTTKKPDTSYRTTEPASVSKRTAFVEIKDSARSLFIESAKKPHSKATGQLSSPDPCESSDDLISPLVFLPRKTDSLDLNKHYSKDYGPAKASLFDSVHIMPVIEASITSSEAVICEPVPKCTPHVEKKKLDRCLFPEPPVPTVENPVETPIRASKEPQSKEVMSCAKEKPIESSHSKSTQLPASVTKPSQPADKTKLQLKTIKVKGKKYMIMKKLGSGGSSEVVKVLDLSTSNEYAVKCVSLATDREMAQGYLNEVRVLRDLQKSDRVVKLYDFEHDKSARMLRLLIEVGETDLDRFLRRHHEGAPPALVLHYWEEMLRAVQEIHSHGIVHADLKPANFLLVSGQLKLIDFGIASAVSGDATSVHRSCGKGTFSYISPEAVGGDGTHPIKVSFYSDVWSLGCILYSLVYGRTPFAHLRSALKLVAIRDPNHSISYPATTSVPRSLVAAMKTCLQYNGHSRPTVTQLLKINHLSTKREQSLPEALLNKLRSHVTQEEMDLLQTATLGVS